MASGASGYWEPDDVAASLSIHPAHHPVHSNKHKDCNSMLNRAAKRAQRVFSCFSKKMNKIKRRGGGDHLVLVPVCACRCCGRGRVG